MSQADAVRTVLDPVLGRLGLVLEDVSVTPAGRRRVARVVIDRDIAGTTPGDDTDDTSVGDVMIEPVPALSLDEVAEASRAVSDALDETDVLGSQAYTLEVTSPGVDRPLTLPRHVRRNVGRLVRVELRDGEVTGRITRADGDGFEVEVGADEREPDRRRVRYEDLVRARVQVEFARPGTPARGGALSPETDGDGGNGPGVGTEGN